MKILAECGDASLELEVADDADLDGQFVGRCLDTGELLTVKGWMIENLERLDPAIENLDAIRARALADQARPSNRR